MHPASAWRFIDTGTQSGRVNMEIDEALAFALMEGTGVPTLRVYGWNPPALSLGYHQPLDEVDAARALADGIDIVRRPTGGRAILHAQELTYSVVMKVHERSIASVYDEICAGLMEGLRILGAPVVMETAQPDFPSLYKEDAAAICFSSIARNEIKVAGRKLVGSAQRRYACPDGDDVVLQHGSLMLGPRHKEIVNYLKAGSDEVRQRLRAIMEERTTELELILGRSVSYEEAAAALRSGFEQAWGVRFA